MLHFRTCPTRNKYSVEVESRWFCVLSPLIFVYNSYLTCSRTEYEWNIYLLYAKPLPINQSINHGKVLSKINIVLNILIFYNFIFSILCTTKHDEF